ncbi:fused [Angomonas deanei]|uniref:non-specific serine/threonine protein kinase n=1 Tax=Angomonas deanei TaxID=59799 RepID=A0A7G2CID6_9TRYP|nr:fused [Angomonas deanei]CAD2219526.1 Armadillo/beta-catenin-like repeat, putative [Angomonas deanei]|eukprot:EPY21263.1 fused [Angomonas deanei]
MNAKKVQSLATQGLYAVTRYKPEKKPSKNNAQLIYASAACLFVAYLQRELRDVVSINVDNALMDSLCLIIEGVKSVPNRPVEPRALGTSFGCSEYGLLDGVAHIMSVIFSDPKSVVYMSDSSKRNHRFLEGDSRNLFRISLELLRDSDSKIELSPNGVQTLLRCAQQVLQQEREQENSMNLFIEPIAPYSGQPQGSLTLIALVCRHLGTDYLHELHDWPESRGGGAVGVSAHLTIICQIITDSFRLANPNSAEDDAVVRDIQQILYKEKLMEMLVQALDYTEIAFWGTPFAIISKLVNSSQHFAKAFVDGGGLEPNRIQRVLDVKKSSTGLISDGLNVLSQLARLSKDFYPAIHGANLYDTFAVLFQQTEKEIRGKMCTLIGNLCKHSPYFYEPMSKYKLVDGLVNCCNDKDAYTQKFSAFAVGNAAFHSDYLYADLKPSIPAILKLLSSSDDKTRQNAAGALSNFVRNGDQLVDKLVEYRAAEALLNMLKNDKASLKSIIVITINSFCVYPVFRDKLVSSGLLQVIDELESDPSTCNDATIKKYVGRIKDRINQG